MNRPKMDSYDLSTKYTMCVFIRDLEKYCNELEKRETPMKVHKKSIMEELRLGSARFCPSCDNWLIRGYNNNYCSKCGQRLEYEDD